MFLLCQTIAPGSYVYLTVPYPGTLATGRIDAGSMVKVQDTPFTEENITKGTVLAWVEKGSDSHPFEVRIHEVCAVAPRTMKGPIPEWGRTLTKTRIVNTVVS